MKIAVYSIAKDEALFAARFCEAAKNADLIFVADTGSADGTAEILKANGAQVADIRVRPWRFDDARNAALAMLPDDIDVCMSLDLDEVLQPGWREEIERVWEVGTTTRLRYGFDWTGAEDPKDSIIFQYEKCHARFGYRWHHPCHEYPVPDRIAEVWAETHKLLVVHKPDPNKSRGQYLDLLRVSVEEDPACPRNAFYYQRELSFNNRWPEAIEAGNRYLALPRATWPNERCYSMRVTARCYAELGDQTSALTWARKAIAEAPDTREPWAETAMLAYRASMWAECYGAAISGLAITRREWLYTVDPAVWGSQLHDLASVAAWNLGMREKAIEHGRNALEIEPNNERLNANLKLMERPIDQLEAAE